MTTLIAPQPMLARRQLRLAAVAALEAIAGLTVESPGDWNTPASKLPSALVRVSGDHKEGAGSQEPEFTTSVDLEVLLRVQGLTAEATQDAIEALGYSVEQALFTDYSVVGMLNRFSSIETEIEITSEGREHLGRASMRVTGELFESFDPTEAAPLPTTWPVAAPATVPLDSVGVHADLTNIYDPSGTYAPSPDAPPYTPTPAPRTSGPDGRDEGALDLQLPQ
ncbi:MAG: hypothetical protein M0T84_00280 [Betaproteobacteria bacterium]|nr:hypothetical protein [Betaproteobacteria bacterium]